MFLISHPHFFFSPQNASLRKALIPECIEPQLHIKDMDGKMAYLTVAWTDRMDTQTVPLPGLLNCMSREAGSALLNALESWIPLYSSIRW